MNPERGFFVDSEEAVCECGDWQGDHEDFVGKCHVCNPLIQLTPACTAFRFSQIALRKVWVAHPHIPILNSDGSPR